MGDDPVPGEERIGYEPVTIGLWSSDRCWCFYSAASSTAKGDVYSSVDV